MLETQIQTFLSQQRVCSLTTLLNNGAPHAAALHFSHTLDPLRLYFSTENTSVKCEALLSQETTLGSVAIGFSEEEWITFQLDGVVRIVPKAELPDVQVLHYAKHPNSAKFKDDPTTVFLQFTPTWWRYTDYNTAPPTIVLSEK